jgi:rare lipoprotein A
MCLFIHPKQKTYMSTIMPKTRYHLLRGNPGRAGFGSVKLLKKGGLAAACLLLQLTVYCQRDTTLSKIKTMFGVASFYSKHFEGGKTATGETFHHSEMVAASNSFKLNTWVRITNMRNGQSVIVRINDRMGKAMQALGRVADVTLSAAQQLGFINRGLTRVKVEEVPAGTAQ